MSETNEPLKIQLCHKTKLLRYPLMFKTKSKKCFSSYPVPSNVKSVPNMMCLFGFIGLFSVFLISGCESTKNLTATQMSSDASAANTSSVGNEKPILVTAVLDVQSAEIQKDAKKLIESRNFALIETKATQYRNSHEMFLDGFAKLGYFYKGLMLLSNEDSEADWEARYQLIRQWATSNPNSITANVALARIYYEGALQARGGSYANDVSKKQWAKMNQRLTEAAKVLSDSASMRNQCPCWFIIAQNVAFLQQRPLEEFDSITNAAIQQFPYYYDFYFGKINYLMPRWFGKKGDWQKYAGEVANKMGGDDGDIFYARALWDMELLVDTEDSVELADFDWPRAKRGFNLLLKEPNSFGAASAFAQAAWLVQDQKQLKSLFDDPIGNHYDHNTWLTEDEFQKARNWAYNG